VNFPFQISTFRFRHKIKKIPTKYLKDKPDTAVQAIQPGKKYSYELKNLKNPDYLTALDIRCIPS
jgi:hypothetical protein